MYLHVARESVPRLYVVHSLASQTKMGNYIFNNPGTNDFDAAVYCSSPNGASSCGANGQTMRTLADLLCVQATALAALRTRGDIAGKAYSHIDRRQSQSTLPPEYLQRERQVGPGRSTATSSQARTTDVLHLPCP